MFGVKKGNWTNEFSLSDFFEVCMEVCDGAISEYGLSDQLLALK